MTDHIEAAIKTSGVLPGDELPWFHLAVASVEALSTLALAADSAARTYKAVTGRPSPPSPPRRL